MGNFILGAATATALSYAYVIFGWSVPAIFKVPNMIRALPEKVAVIELIDDPELTDEHRQRAIALRIRSDPGKIYREKVRGAMTSNAIVRTYVAERFGTEDADIAAIALASAPVEYCGVDIQVRG